MEEDSELKVIEQKKMAQMRKRLMESTPQKPQKAERTPRQLVEELLTDRGDEVLETAYYFYPAQTERVVAELAKMIGEGRLKGKVSGGELYSVFRQIGLRFNLKTSIRVQDHGKLVDLGEKLRKKDE